LVFVEEGGFSFFSMSNFNLDERIVSSYFAFVGSRGGSHCTTQRKRGK
jgi:hypothetical protein